MMATKHSLTTATVLAALALAGCAGEDDGDSMAMDMGMESESNMQASGEWQHPVTPWGDPDLQGMWPVQHLISVPLQRPEEYGDRLYFNEAELAEQRAAVAARNERYENEDSSDRIGMGHWAETTGLPPQTSLIVDPPNGQLPPLTAAGREKTDAMGTSWGNEVFDSPADFDSWDRCITRGMPASMFPFQYNNGIQIVQAPGYVVINLEMIHEARIVRLDAPKLDAGVKQWLGDSRGHFEGNTLVVETTNFNGKVSMTNFGSPGAPPTRATSTEYHLLERFERVDEDTINYAVTVTDPVTQTGSWTAAYPLQLDPDYQFFEYACNEDNYAIRNFIETSRIQRDEAGGDN